MKTGVVAMLTVSALAGVASAQSKARRNCKVLCTPSVTLMPAMLRTHLFGAPLVRSLSTGDERRLPNSTQFELIVAVHFFDRRSGAPLGSVGVSGLALNDVAFAPDGSLWITDAGPERTRTPVDTTHDLDAVWRMTRDGKVAAVARGLGLERPGGVVLDGQSAFVGRLDGLRRLPDGSLLVTSWDARAVWRLDAAYAIHAVLSRVTSPAGIAVDTRRHRLAVTSMQDNTLYLLPLSE